MASPRRAVIITALPIERQAVLAHLRDVTEEPPVQGSIYRRGIFDERSEPWDIIVAEIGAGNEGAAAEAVRVISHYSPQVAVFVGVAGAIKDLKHGDVVASTKVYGYESGKEKGGFKTRPGVQLSSYSLEQRARFEAGEEAWRQRIKGPSEPGVVSKAGVAPLAAGEKVVASNRSPTFSFLRRTYNDAVGVEMEGHGFLLGVHMSEPTKGIVIRGISDLVNDKDEQNDEKWQPIAASNAAAFAFQILAKLPPVETQFAVERANASSPQEVRFGNITGDNITVSVNQHQGPVTHVAGPAAPDGNAEIDRAVDRLLNGEPDLAIQMLSNLRRHRWNGLNDRERFRLVANLGHAEERKGNFRKAAQHFIEAKQHQAEDEQAQALEAVAYSYLGETARAYELANAVLARHPTSVIAAAVRVRCAPDGSTISELEQSVPVAIRDTDDVLFALSWRALRAGEPATAERLTRTALRWNPDWADLQEQLSATIIQGEAWALRDGKRPADAGRLGEAVSLLSSTLTKVQGRKNIARLRFTRAGAYHLLGRLDEAEADFRAAWHDDDSDPQIPFRLAALLERRDQRTAAIDVLRQSLKTAPDAQNVMYLANLLGERNGPGDRAAAVGLVETAVKEATAADTDTRTGLVGALTHLHSAERHFSEALAVLDGLPPMYLTEFASLVLRAEVLGRAGKKDEAVALAKKSLTLLDAHSPDHDRLRLADVLNTLEQRSDALALWKQVLKPVQADAFVVPALECARQVGDDGFVLSFCAGLRANGVYHPYCLEVEVVTLERYACYEDAIAIMQQYLTAPANDALARVFRARLSLIGLRTGRPNLVETDVAKLPKVESAPVQVGGAVACILHHGPRPQEGVQYAYELVRRHFNDPEARQFYFAAAGVNDELLATFPQPDTVCAGCAVRYREDDSTEEKWLIIEDGPDPRLERREVSTDHLWAKEMEGKKVGDQFYLRRDEFQDRTATILAIHSKYVYRKYEIFDSWEDLFPHIFFVRKYTFTHKEDGSPNVEPFLRVLDRREQQAEQLNSLYRQHPLSVTTFSRLSKMSILDSLRHIATEGSLSVRCCAGSVEEFQEAEPALRSAIAVVIDPSALATLFFSGQYEHLGALSAKCVVCESALQEFRDLARELASGPAGFMGKHKGKILWMDDDPTNRERQLEKVNQFLAGIQSVATVETGRALAGMDPETKRKMISLFGQPTAESIAAARGEGIVLWSDDFAVGLALREEFGGRRVWTQLVFQMLATDRKISSETYMTLVVFLLEWSYFFTRIYPETVLLACRAAGWDPKASPLAKVLQWIGVPELNEEGATMLCAAALPRIWRLAALFHQAENVTRALMESLLSRNNGRELVAAIRGTISWVFGIDVVSARSCAAAIEDVLEGRTPSGLILPR